MHQLTGSIRVQRPPTLWNTDAATCSSLMLLLMIMVKMKTITVAWPTFSIARRRIKGPRETPLCSGRACFSRRPRQSIPIITNSCCSCSSGLGGVSFRTEAPCGGLVCFPWDGRGTAQINAVPLRSSQHPQTFRLQWKMLFADALQNYIYSSWTGKRSSKHLVLHHLNQSESRYLNLSVLCFFHNCSSDQMINVFEMGGCQEANLNHDSPFISIRSCWRHWRNVLSFFFFIGKNLVRSLDTTNLQITAFSFQHVLISLMAANLIDLFTNRLSARSRIQMRWNNLPESDVTNSPRGITVNEMNVSSAVHRLCVNSFTLGPHRGLQTILFTACFLGGCSSFLEACYHGEVAI